MYAKTRCRSKQRVLYITITHKFLSVFFFYLAVSIIDVYNNKTYARS